MSDAQEANPDLLLSGYDFELPEALIAQEPALEREGSRLMRLDRVTGVVSHHRFRDLPSFLRSGDLLVLNDTRVIPARLRGQRPHGGRLEALLLRSLGEASPAIGAFAERWEAMVRPSAKVRTDEPLVFGEHLVAWPEARSGDHWILRLEADRPIRDAIDAEGEIPLPPYIRRDPGERRSARDLERYQTVYAQHPGSAAAPTAGLHFTPGLLEALAVKGVEVRTLTLHVGAGTFSPVRSERLLEHRMHVERYTIPAALWEAVRRAKLEGRRVVAVGTTSVRALEAAAQAEQAGETPAGERETSIFIFPGFQIRVVDAMITNFHLPRSSLIMLVGAFAGRERVLAAYRIAVEQGYRFFSYGDAMFIA